MSRASTPGSPAGRPGAPAGHRAQSFDYAEDEDEVALDPALVTSPGHGAVGVFQAPRPVSRRTPPAEPTAVTAGENADIDSPFLDLFGGARPGGQRAIPAAPTTREQQAIPQQPPAVAPARPVPELEPPWTPDDRSSGGRRPVEPRRPDTHPTTESRVPHQAGDRLPMAQPASDLDPAARAASPSRAIGPATRAPDATPAGRPAATPTNRSAAPVERPPTPAERPV
ncbi:hypothetical protein [Micromonospora orduensis]|uniref:hypothetical protein n=1 Tax=Micromonospora orduensis TaxID=1420891 RepID=UPI0033BFDDAC